MGAPAGNRPWPMAGVVSRLSPYGEECGGGARGEPSRSKGYGGARGEHGLIVGARQRRMGS